jgi:hypothetical protein
MFGKGFWRKFFKKTGFPSEIFLSGISFPLISGKHTVYILEKIRYNEQNEVVCPAAKKIDE